ncbi:MAG: prepilin peptidase [Candidatus Pacebacteria bacterium]|nr:prepilin peptidase [Candidatus Paceibacterota bacterium]
MNIIAFIFIFLLGTIIGSFLNVVIYRLNTGKSFVCGRSICMTCSRSLRWYELIPIFSFLIQSGKCRRCASKISHQYPLVEFGTGLIFVLIAKHFLPILFISYWSFLLLFVLFSYIFSLLIIISVYDIRHKIIPNKLAYLYAFVSFVSIFLSYQGGSLGLAFPSTLALFSGPIFAIPFAFLWLVSKGKWMGLGDAKLVLGLGWMLGPAHALSAVILSFWIGAIFGLFTILFSKKKVGMKTEIPFAPFLIIGTMIAFFFNLDIFGLIRLLQV